MASFKDRVEGLTRVTIIDSSSPNTGDLESYLHQGVQDFYTRWTGINPQDVYMFARESLLFDGAGTTDSDTYSSDANFELKGGKILSVMRENGTALSFRNCRRVSYGLQDRVNDVDSLHYASKFNPAFYVTDDNKVNVAPDASTSGSSYKVLYTNVEAVDSESEQGSSITLSNKLDYFPKDKEYAVVLYAAIRCIENKLAQSTVIEEDTELATMLNALLSQYKDDYNAVFAMSKAAQAQGAQ